MAQPVTVRGGKVRVLIGEGTAPIVYTAPCGFSSRSLTFSKGLEEVSIPDCDNPDDIQWLGRDATSLSISVSGEGVLALESVDTWDAAFLNVASVPTKIEIEFPAKTITWTGLMHVESIELGATNGARVTQTVSLQSDGLFVRTTAFGQSPANTVLPTTSGLSKVGSVQTATTGTWTGTATITYTYRWKIDGVTITGATTSTYTPVAGDVGKTLTVQVIATNGIGQRTATSAGTIVAA